VAVGHGHVGDHHERRLNGLENLEAGLPGTGHWRWSPYAELDLETSTVTDRNQPMAGARFDKVPTSKLPINS
jgi:hypothetical protein